MDMALPNLVEQPPAPKQAFHAVPIVGVEHMAACSVCQSKYRPVLVDRKQSRARYQFARRYGSSQPSIVVIRWSLSGGSLTPGSSLICSSTSSIPGNDSNQTSNPS